MKLIIATVLLIGTTLLGLVCETTPVVETYGAAYFVATNGDDANPGTFDQPWQTIAKANQELQPGDTVYIREGTYNEIIRPTRSGTADEKITYANYSGESVILRGKAGEGAVVDLSNNHAVVAGFTIDRPHDGRKDKFGWVEIGGNHNTVRGCTIDKPGDPLAMYRDGYRERGVLVFGQDNIIENNYVKGHNQGIHMSKISRRTTIRNNTVSGTGQSPIVVETSLGKIRGLLIEGNTLERSAIEDGIQFMQDYDSSDMENDVSNLGTIVRNNIIRYNAENAIDLKGAAHVVIEGNIIYGTVGSNDGPLNGYNRNSLWTIGRGSHTSSRDVIIRNNVLYDNANGIRLFDGYRVYNNTIVGNNRDHTGPNSSHNTTFYGMYHVTGAAAIQNNVVAGHIAELVMKLNQAGTYINNNLYFNMDGVWFVDQADSQRKLSFDQWQSRLQSVDAVSGNDEASFVADPMFVNTPDRPVGEHERFDFHLQDISPAIDAGGPLTRVKGSGSGNQIQVEDAGYFFDGYGVTDGDLIQIGPNTPVRIISVDYDSNIITFDRTVSWEDGDGVSLPYDGAAPDIGAYEYQGYGFTLTAAPASRAINPGGVATYTISIRPVGGFTATVALSSATPSPSLTLTLTPTVATLPRQATLAITDTHTGVTLLPGLWYDISITATGGGVTQTASVGLLVGGSRTYLSLTLRESGKCQAGDRGSNRGVLGQPRGRVN